MASSIETQNRAESGQCNRRTCRLLEKDRLHALPQGGTIAAAVLPAIRELDDDRVRLYCDLVYNSLNEAARHALEAIMKGYEYQSDFAKKYVAQGRAEGRTEEAARALLAVLRARGLAVPDAVRERILSQKDPERLERWLEKAAVAASVTAVLDEPS